MENSFMKTVKTLVKLNAVSFQIWLQDRMLLLGRKIKTSGLSRSFLVKAFTDFMLALTRFLPSSFSLAIMGVLNIVRGIKCS